MTNARLVRPPSGLGKDPIANLGSPMSFTASVTSLSAGQTAVFDSAALQPGYRTPYVIDAITMIIKSPLMFENAGAAAFTVMDGTGWGGLIDFQFQTGHHAFSSKPIAAPSFCPRYVFYTDTLMNQILNGSFGSSQFDTQEELCNLNGSTAASKPKSNFYCVYKWLLPKPLLLLPGDVVNASCKRHPTLASGTTGASDAYGTVDATVTYTGRALPPGTRLPKYQCVPWVGMFDQVDLCQTSATAITPWASANREFENPFQTDWHVQRLIARRVAASAYNDMNDDTIRGVNNDVNTGGSGSSIAVVPYTVKITDPLGYQITNGYVPITAIANYNDQSAWTFSRPVGPRQRVGMEFNFGTFNLPAVAAGAANTCGTRKMVSLVGYREEVL